MAASRRPSTLRALGDLAQVGITFVVATALGLASGYYLDRWLGTSPWLLLIGLGFGIAAGFVNFFRSVKAAERSEHDPE
jgi:F0F1-type ATP synthase assembly protein I